MVVWVVVEVLVVTEVLIVVMVVVVAGKSLAGRCSMNGLG